MRNRPGKIADSFYQPTSYGGPKNYERAIRLNRSLHGKIKFDDLITDVVNWPAWAKQSLFKVHKNRSERMNLWVFLWKNGVPPEKAVEYVLFHGKVGLTTYDASAISSMGDLVKKTLTRDGVSYLNKIKVWDMTAGAVC